MMRGADRGRAAQFVLLIVMLAGAVVLGSEIREGWFPHDEGALGQSAERVLGGEVPHRDFAEIYTGLLSYINAAVFAVLPVNSFSMRVPLFFASLLWLWAMYRMLLRFVSPPWAGVAAMTAFVWGVPNYPAPLPSWYILFLTTGAALALLRWVEDPRPRWLFVAGVAAGIAFLFKLTGIFVLLGGGLALLALDAPDATEDAAPARRGAYPWIVSLFVIVAAAGLGSATGGAGISALVRFALPTTLLLLAVSARAMRPHVLTDAGRWRLALERFSPFLLGAAAPIALYFAVQAAMGALPMLIEGVFVTPFRRSTFASLQPPPVITLLFFIPMAVFLWIRSTGARASKVVPVVGAVWFAAVLVLSATDRRFYQLGWVSAWGLLFFVAIEGARFVRAKASADPVRQAGAIVLACLAVSAALVEYPFAAPIYTLYALPLTIVAAVALVRVGARTAPALQAVVVLFFFAFAVARNFPLQVQMLGQRFVRGGQVMPLELPRSGLLVQPLQSVVYEDIITLVQEKAAGRPIWAGPDAPEIYFLSGLPNRTRTFFEFLDPPEQNARPLVERLDSMGVGVAVVKLRPDFWQRPTKATIDSLRPSFPNQRTFIDYIVLWR